MLEAQLASLHELLRRRARRTMWLGCVLALVGAGLLIEAWTERAPLADRITGALFASVLVAAGAVKIRDGVRRVPPLIARLRDRPTELCVVHLAWIQRPSGPRGRLSFEFEEGRRYDVTLAEDAARAAVNVFRAAFPWAHPRG